MTSHKTREIRTVQEVHCQQQGTGQSKGTKLQKKQRILLGKIVFSIVVLQSRQCITRRITPTPSKTHLENSIFYPPLPVPANTTTRDEAATACLSFSSRAPALPAREAWRWGKKTDASHSASLLRTPAECVCLWVSACLGAFAPVPLQEFSLLRWAFILENTL